MTETVGFQKMHQAQQFRVTLTVNSHGEVSGLTILGRITYPAKYD
jgi:hypothetical protein